MKRKAFTLIELLVVISIIALLMSIMLPALNKVKEVARKTICKSQMRQIVLGAAAYAAEHNENYPQSIGAALPSGSRWPGDAGTLAGMSPEQQDVYVAINATWWGLIGTYTGLEFGKMDTVNQLREMSVGTIGNCPAHGKSESSLEGGKNNFSYHGSGNIFKNWNESLLGVGMRKNPPVKGTEIRLPGLKVLVFEIFNNADWPLTYINGPYRGRPHEGFSVNQGAYNFNPGGQNIGWKPTHGKDLNYGFVDGHVESVNHMKQLDAKYFELTTAPGAP